MSNLRLDYDELVLLTSDDAVWVSRENKNLEEFALTDKRLHCVNKKSNGFLKKASLVDDILSLSDIKTVNGHSLIQQTRHNGSVCLEIQFVQGTEYFTFLSSPKKIISQWVEGINKAMGTTPFLDPNATKKGLFSRVFSDGAKQSLPVASAQYTTPQNATENTPPTPPQQKPETLTPPQQFRYCVNCGEKVATGTRFCPSCGYNLASYDNTKNNTPATENIESIYSAGQQKSVESEIKSVTVQPQRQQEYVGKVYKCPNCGSVVNLSDAVCSSCGYHLAGKDALGSVKDFQNKLLAMEMRRPARKAVRLNLPDTLDSTDKQIISLIKSYPIPNSIDDIVEFMLLAVGSIDIGKAKKSIFNSDTWSGVSREREISRAWVGKMEQLYAKAEMLFPNEPEFARVKELYDNTMKKLKMNS